MASPLPFLCLANTHTLPFHTPLYSLSHLPLHLSLPSHTSRPVQKVFYLRIPRLIPPVHFIPVFVLLGYLLCEGLCVPALTILVHVHAKEREGGHASPESGDGMWVYVRYEDGGSRGYVEVRLSGLDNRKYWRGGICFC